MIYLAATVIGLCLAWVLWYGVAVLVSIAIGSDNIMEDRQHDT
jgi:hypothetical protein